MDFGCVCGDRRAACIASVVPRVRPALLRLPGRSRRPRRSGTPRRTRGRLPGVCRRRGGWGRAGRGALPLPTLRSARRAALAIDGQPEGCCQPRCGNHPCVRPAPCAACPRRQPGIRRGCARRADPPAADPVWRLAELSRPLHRVRPCRCGRAWRLGHGARLSHGHPSCRGVIDSGCRCKGFFHERFLPLGDAGPRALRGPCRWEPKCRLPELRVLRR